MNVPPSQGHWSTGNQGFRGDLWSDEGNASLLLGLISKGGDPHRCFSNFTIYISSEKNFSIFTYSLSLSKDQRYTFVFKIIFPLQCLRLYDSAKHGVWLFLLLGWGFHPDMLSLYKHFCELPGHLTRHIQHVSVLEGAKLRFKLIPHHLLGLSKGIGQKFVALKPLAYSSISKENIWKWYLLPKKQIPEGKTSKKGTAGEEVFLDFLSNHTLTRIILAISSKHPGLS